MHLLLRWGYVTVCLLTMAAAAAIASGAITAADLTLVTAVVAAPAATGHLLSRRRAARGDEAGVAQNTVERRRRG